MIDYLCFVVGDEEFWTKVLNILTTHNNLIIIFIFSKPCLFYKFKLYKCFDSRNSRETSIFEFMTHYDVIGI